VLSFHAVSKRYAETLAVDAVSLEIPTGAFAVVIGESGSGKSTLLKTVNRLVQPTSGEVRQDDEDLGTRDPVSLRRSIGYVFQGVGLFPHMTAAENVGITPRLLGWPEEQVEARVAELLDLMGLPPAEYADRKPRQLSGGQRQRVGFARALAARPSLLLLDEPFGALDPVIRTGVRDDLKRIHASLGLTTLMVTHDMAEALLLADLIAVMQNGRLVQAGAPADVIARPADDYVAALIETPRREAAALEALEDQAAADRAGGAA
jgi:osmoprotectant transport system ATP-binding protein